ncbi:transposase [Sphingobium cloacae]|uniref:transposase n=1 Tax=Sphingobium cloacae TaxID=120107 RepID=UPI000BBAD95B
MAEAIVSEPKGERRRWSDDEKRAAVELSLEPGASVKEVRRALGCRPPSSTRGAASCARDAPARTRRCSCRRWWSGSRRGTRHRQLRGGSCPRRWWQWHSRSGGASVVIARGAEPALAAAVISALQGMR